jgi:hypothetical protein
MATDVKSTATEQFKNLIGQLATGQMTVYSAIKAVVGIYLGIIGMVLLMTVMDMVAAGNYLGLVLIAGAILIVAILGVIISEKIKQILGIDLMSLATNVASTTAPSVPSSTTVETPVAEDRGDRDFGGENFVETASGKGENINWAVWSYLYYPKNFVVTGDIPNGLYPVYLDNSGSSTPDVFYDSTNNIIYAKPTAPFVAELARQQNAIKSKAIDAFNAILSVTSLTINNIAYAKGTIINGNLYNEVIQPYLLSEAIKHGRTYPDFVAYINAGNLEAYVPRPIVTPKPVVIREDSDEKLVESGEDDVYKKKDGTVYRLYADGRTEFLNKL